MSMSRTLNIEQRNRVLSRMADLVAKEKQRILSANDQDMRSFDQEDLAMFDRLKVERALNALADVSRTIGTGLGHPRRRKLRLRLPSRLRPCQKPKSTTR